MSFIPSLQASALGRRDAGGEEKTRRGRKVKPSRGPAPGRARRLNIGQIGLF
jgi:hypothetical protein